MPYYDLAAVAQAVELEVKQLDNLISRSNLRGVTKKKRGIARRLTPEVVVVIQLAKDLADAFGLSPGSLLPLADRLAQVNPNERYELAIGSFGKLEIDTASLRESIIARLNNAVEAVGRRRRGRPSLRAQIETHEA